MLKRLGIESHDLTAATRPGMITEIMIGDRFEEPWIKCGLVSVASADRGRSSYHKVSAKFGRGAVDEEGDSAFAFSFGIRGMYMESMQHGVVVIRGVIGSLYGDDEDFRYPNGDPLKDVPEGEEPVVEYLPPINRELHLKLNAQAITIVTRIPCKEDEEHC